MNKNKIKDKLLISFPEKFFSWRSIFSSTNIVKVFIPMFVTTVATPKQIRELMNVDGLTNDEVKSHLQVSS